MKLIFAGTPEFAACALRSLLQAGHEVCLVLSQPDRPAGRGMKLLPSPVKQLALEHGLPVLQPRTLKEPGIEDQLRQTGAEVMVVAAYGLILPRAVLDLPVHGAINIHASLLPRWRGAAPIQRAILAGDAHTGICIMRMEAGLDTGPILLRESLDILADDTAGTLHDRLALCGGRLIVEALALLHAGGLVPVVQPDQGVTYAHKIDKQEACIDWAQPAADIARRIRAFNPFPGAHSMIHGVDLKIWRALPQPGGQGVPAGTVTEVSAAGITVACGEGRLLLQELQRPGARRMSASDLWRGFKLVAGDRFGDDRVRGP